MKVFEYKNKFIEYQRFAFKCMFLIYSIFLATEFSMIKSFNLPKIIIILWGIIILMYDLSSSRGKMFKNNVLMSLFLILSLITLLANKLGFSDLKLYLITVLQVLVLNSCSKNDKALSIKEQIFIINIIVIILTFILTAIAIIFSYKGIEISNILYFDPQVTRMQKLFRGFYIVSTTAGMICYFSSAITIIALMTLPKNIKNRILIFSGYIVNLIVQLYGLFISGARGALISFLVFVIIALFMFIKSKKIRLGVLGITFIMIFSFMFGKSNIYEIDFLNKNNGSNFFTGRLELWEEGYKYVFKEKPLIGDGPNKSILDIRKSSDKVLTGLEGGRVHNIYLDVLYSNGIFALALLGIFILKRLFDIYVNAFSIKRENNNIYMKLIFALMVSNLVLNTVESLLLYVINISSVLFWIYMGISKDLLDYDK